MFARGSLRFVAPFLVISLIVGIFEPILGLIPALFAVYLLWFFRDPPRTIPINDNEVLAAADGTVLSSETNGTAFQLSIRMSPFDVHINRSPIDGTIKAISHKSGAHKSVYLKNVDRNEQNLILIESDGISAEILQITGFFARRIEVWVEKEQSVKKGDKIGMIRFGSQTDMSVQITDKHKKLVRTVDVGDRVHAGITIVGRIEGG